MREYLKTQIRMSDGLHRRIMRIADETGDSLNGTMLHLLHLGLKFYESDMAIQCSDSSDVSIGPLSSS